MLTGPFILRHQPTWLGRVWRLFGRFWQTEITEQGIWMSQYLTQPILLPWSSITCLDLGGLKVPDLSVIKHSNVSLRFYLGRQNRRFFLIMSDDHSLLRRAARFSGPKTWQPGINVLALTRIRDDSAELARVRLEELAKSQQIKLDGIWLPGL